MCVYKGPEKHKYISAISFRLVPSKKRNKNTYETHLRKTVSENNMARLTHENY